MVFLTLFASLFFVFSLVSGRLERTVLTAPIVFAAMGMLMFFVHAPIVRAGFNASIFLSLAELGLVLLLFTDASQTELVGLRNVESLSDHDCDRHAFHARVEADVFAASTARHLLRTSEFRFGLFLAYRIGVVDRLFAAAPIWTPH
jgi:hypothetical protein